MDIYGYPWISMDIHEYPWISLDIHGYQWISTYIHGFACSRSRRTFPGQLFDRRTICLAQPHALTKATRRPQTPPLDNYVVANFSIKHCTSCVNGVHAHVAQTRAQRIM